MQSTKHETETIQCNKQTKHLGTNTIVKQTLFCQFDSQSAKKMKCIQLLCCTVLLYIYWLLSYKHNLEYIIVIAESISFTSTIRYKGVGCQILTYTSDSPWSFCCLSQTSECLQRILSFHACFIKTKIVSFSQLVFYLQKHTIAVITEGNTRLKTNDEISIIKVTYL